MKAKYNPQNPDRLPIKLRGFVGKIINVKHARPNGGVNQYWPDDLLLSSSVLIPETDLEFEEEQTDVYCAKCSSLCNVVYHLPPVCL
ncbi:MAG: hypothetical protein KAJ19_14530 [Gammaproteobacteria bacterium]|nr:hypothetical protein [Gammaproteobacteria bacterium]